MEWKLHTLQQVLWVAATSCYYVLMGELYASRSCYLCPFFTAYITALCIYYPLWNPYDPRLQAIAEPLLIALKFDAVLEAFLLATRRVSNRERRGLLLLLMGIGFVGIFVTSLGSVPAPAQRMIRQYAHVGIAIASVFGVLAMWIHPPMIWPHVRNHGMILALLCANFAIVGFLPRHTLGEWMTANCVFFAASIGCTLLWLWRGLLVTKPVNLDLKISRAVQ